jgi:hypothetical protein
MIVKSGSHFGFVKTNHDGPSSAKGAPTGMAVTRAVSGTYWSINRLNHTLAPAASHRLSSEIRWLPPRLRLALDAAHVTLAFAASSVINIESGRQVKLEQRTIGRRLW